MYQVFDSRQRGRGFKPHLRHYVVSLSKDINPSLVLVQPNKTRPFITEKLLMGGKESNQTNKNICFDVESYFEPVLNNRHFLVICIYPMYYFLYRKS